MFCTSKVPVSIQIIAHAKERWRHLQIITSPYLHDMNRKRELSSISCMPRSKKINASSILVMFWKKFIFVEKNTVFCQWFQWLWGGLNPDIEMPKIDLDWLGFYQKGWTHLSCDFITLGFGTQWIPLLPFSHRFSQGFMVLTDDMSTAWKLPSQRVANLSRKSNLFVPLERIYSGRINEHFNDVLKDHRQEGILLLKRHYPSLDIR